MAELTPRQIQRVVTKTTLHAPNRNSLYWCAQPYQARLAQLESIRQQYHLWKYGAEPGFQRVYKVVNKQASGRLQDLADLENLPDA